MFRKTKNPQRQFDVTTEDLESLSPSATANLLWGLAKTEAAFADSFDRECLETLAADMGPKLLSFSPRVSERETTKMGRGADRDRETAADRWSDRQAQRRRQARGRWRWRLL